MSFLNSNGMQSGGNRPSCPSGQGSLPACGPFAVPFVVSQGTAPQRYSKTKALENGTLFPDLDLPFHLKVNAPQLADTKLNQLRALDFVIQELGLYLDTHPNDSEAFALFQNYVELEKAARESYVEQHGPLTQNDAMAPGPGSIARRRRKTCLYIRKSCSILSGSRTPTLNWPHKSSPSTAGLSAIGYDNLCSVFDKKFVKNNMVFFSVDKFDRNCCKKDRSGCGCRNLGLW